MSEKRKPTQKRRKRKSRKDPKKVLIACLATTCIVLSAILIVYKMMDQSITNLYNSGEEIPLDIRTADEIKDDVVNILVCGLDWEEDRTAMMTDVIMYVTLDAKAKKVSVLQIPRDTYVGSPSPTGKINGVYQNGKEKDKIMNVVNVLNTKFGLSIDHYVTLDMQAFISIVDGIEGGLEMYVPYPVINVDKNTGKTETVIQEPGWHYVNGTTAEAIVRNRNYADGDVARLEVQSYFYAAVIKYFKDIGLSDSLKLMPRFTKHITTDMHWTRMASLAATGLSIDFNDMVMIKPPLHGFRVNGQDVLEIQHTQWLSLINTYFRPYQTEITKIDVAPVQGEKTLDYGVTQTVTQSIGEILASAGAK